MKRRNRLFQLPENAPLPELAQGGASGSFVSKYLISHFEKIAKLEADLKRLPEKEEFFFLQSDNSFNAFTFIPWTCKHRSIQHLYATTYSINQRVIQSLVELHKSGLIDKITLCISDTMLKRNALTADLLSAMNKQYPNIEVIFSWVHAKVCLMQSEDDFFCIEGSGNWSENAYYEQYLFANSKGLFDFRMKLFTEVEVRYRAMNGENVRNPNPN